MANATGKTYVNANTAGHHSYVVLTADADNSFVQNTTQVTDPITDNHNGRWTPQSNPKVAANGRLLFIKMKCATSPQRSIRPTDIPPDGNLSITLTGSSVTQPVVVPVSYSDDPTS